VSPVKYELGFYIPEDDILHCHCQFLGTIINRESHQFRLSKRAESLSVLDWGSGDPGYIYPEVPGSVPVATRFCECYCV
jgi:hypothetical protein